jgi:hypothetical protein
MSSPSAAGRSRRAFLKLGGTSLALIPLVNLTGCSPRDDAGTQQAPATDPDAQRLTPQEPAPPPSPPPTTDAAQEYVFLDEDAPDAQALSYVHDAADVDAAAHPRYEAGQTCANCALYQDTVAGVVQTGDGLVPVGELPDWGGCTIFPGRLVNAAGWCSAWVPRA